MVHFMITLYYPSYLPPISLFLSFIPTEGDDFPNDDAKGPTEREEKKSSELAGLRYVDFIARTQRFLLTHHFVECKLYQKALQ